jgi:hypothetical protein
MFTPSFLSLDGTRLFLSFYFLCSLQAIDFFYPGGNSDWGKSREIVSEVSIFMILAKMVK